ncbi:MAG: PIN domain-containing protein [Spirochaetales bacterium]|nr:PIN domain-containing protein [Spirochaetales bacterium]
MNNTELQVVSFDAEDLLKIAEIHSQNTNNASFTDCSVWYHAKKAGGRLLTGDSKLRKVAENNDLKVSHVLVYSKLFSVTEIVSPMVVLIKLSSAPSPVS